MELQVSDLSSEYCIICTSQAKPTQKIHPKGLNSLINNSTGKLRNDLVKMRQNTAVIYRIHRDCRLKILKQKPTENAQVGPAPKRLRSLDRNEFNWKT